MPEQHREFFCNQEFILLGVTNREGRPVACAVVGPRGFITSPDPTKLMLEPLQRLEPGTQPPNVVCHAHTCLPMSETAP